MQNRSMVFKCVPLFCSCSTCMVLWMGPKECECSIKCLVKLDDWLAVLNAFLCSLKRVAKFLPVFPIYALPQSGHVNLYTPDCESISVLCCLCGSSVCMELLVRNAIFMLVFLKRWVMKLVSLPTYVKVAHLGVGVCVCVLDGCFLLLGGGSGVGRWNGKPLLCRTFWMMVVCLVVVFM